MKPFIFAIGLLILSQTVLADDAKEQFQVNSPVSRLYSSNVPGFPNITNDANDSKACSNVAAPFPLATSGDLKVGDSDALLTALGVSEISTKVVLIHVLRWADYEHKNVNFQKWFVLDRGSQSGGFYLASAQKRFEGSQISGHKQFVLVYIHFNCRFDDTHESIRHDKDSNKDELINPVDYGIEITKQNTQLQKDFATVLEIAGVTLPKAADHEIGYFSYFQFDSNFETSQIAVTAKLKPSNPAAGTKTDQSSTNANALASRTFDNEKPAHFGLSFAVPLHSYKDVQVDSNTLQPKTIDRQNIYLTLDAYLPAAQPGLTNFRYVPHPFFGVPIKGQPLRQTMVGLAVGLRWLEPFGGVVFDVQKKATGTSTLPSDHLVLKGVFGLKVSVDSVKKALKK